MTTNMHLHATQIRAARAILNWSQEELAGRSGVGVTTIRQVESGCVPRRQTTESLRDAFESAGLEFLENEGVRLRAEHINVLSDKDSCHKLYDDILRSVLSGADEIMACVSSYQVFLESLGLIGEEGRDRIKRLSEYTSIKCLVADSAGIEKSEPLIKVKHVYDAFIGRVQYFVYGRKYAMVLPRNNGDHRFIIFNTPSDAFAYRKEFQDLWNGKIPKDRLLEMRDLIDRLLYSSAS